MLICLWPLYLLCSNHVPWSVMELQNIEWRGPHSQEVGGTLIGEDRLQVMTGAESVEWNQIHQTRGFHVSDAIPFCSVLAIIMSRAPLSSLRWFKFTVRLYGAFCKTVIRNRTKLGYNNYQENCISKLYTIKSKPFYMYSHRHQCTHTALLVLCLSTIVIKTTFLNPKVLFPVIQLNAFHCSSQT